MISVEQLMECLAGETEVLEENLPHYRFVRHKSHMTSLGLEPVPLSSDTENRYIRL
jgi:hypothetical protein